ncbi:protein of unknown function [Paraburkholderia dioscoreae]|uniref:Uncharacterized protein n=1 Tax=Paraburkholderia dioscoreae TaxID=2604047 RepID=A0A5Q4Z361_9BURK|nr:protein of unknown function [Paraburkholderia dioscoreae]
MSIRPYSVTLPWAWTAPAQARQPSVAAVESDFFIVVNYVRAGCGRGTSWGERCLMRNKVCGIQKYRQLFFRVCSGAGNESLSLPPLRASRRIFYENLALFTLRLRGFSYDPGRGSPLREAPSWIWFTSSQSLRSAPWPPLS